MVATLKAKRGSLLSAGMQIVLSIFKIILDASESVQTDSLFLPPQKRSKLKSFDVGNIREATNARALTIVFALSHSSHSKDSKYKLIVSFPGKMYTNTHHTA